MKVTGIIKKIIPNKNKPNMVSILVDEEWFSIFTKDGKYTFEKGDVIEAEYLTKGIFKNINQDTIKIIGKGHINEDDSTDSIIRKQACLKASSPYSKTAEENITNAKILYNSLGQEW